GVGAHLDIMPTFLKAAGANKSQDKLEGGDLLPLITGKGETPMQTRCWAFGEQRAIRQGKWKLTLGGLEEDRSTTAPGFLADLEADPGERHDLSEAHPEIAGQLRRHLQQFCSTLKDH